MGKINVLLCDDCMTFMQSIKSFIECLYPDKFIIDMVTDKSFHLDKEYDVYFLDIEMPTVSGFELARKIHNKYPQALLVFLTTHEELSMEGYEYKAFRFISKHRKEQMLPPVLKAIISEFDKCHEYIVAKRADDLSESVFIKDIAIIMSEGNYVTFFTSNGIYRKRIKAKEMTEKYNLSTFQYTERGILVNISHVIQFDRSKFELVLENGKTMKIGRRYRKEFTEQYVRIRSNHM